MSRSAKKHSSGFYDDNDNNNMNQFFRRKHDENGETSSSSSDYLQQENNRPKHRMPTPPPAPMLSPYKIDEEIYVINSDSEDEISNNNNNEEASPDRHRVPEERDSVDTEKRDDSNSNDVIFVEESTEEIENLSCITSNVSLDPADKVSASDFKILKLLGTGAYGRVYLVKKLKGVDEGNLYAMKVLEKVKVMQKKKTTEHTRTEREVLEKIIDCPFLAKMYYAFQTPEKLYLVLGFEQGGELFTHLYKSEHFTESQVRFYIAEIIVALEQLHKLQVIYRDIKLENILLDAGGHIVITDFGLSKELKDGARTHSFCGTIEYMAPEIVSQCREGHDLNVDWWSVGVLMIELLTGQSPFSRDGEESNQNQISDRIQNEPPNIPTSIEKPAKDLIVKLLEKTPSRRLGFRNDAEDLKCHEFFESIDWHQLKKKTQKAPIVPQLRDNEDVSQFAEDFTKQKPEDLPAEKPTQPNAANYFRGYSFVAPKFRRKRREETKTSNRLDPERPSLSKVLHYQTLGRGKFFKKYVIDKEDQPIGDGTYSICLRCRSKETGKFYAVKIMNPLHDASQEIAALEKCKGHENIVEVVENLEDSRYKYIVFELLSGGELFQRIRQCNHFMEPLARSHFRQLVNAVEFMHHRNIVHRDLKPENAIFVDHNDNSLLKIVDFGFARRRTSEETPPCYTLDYAAPESLTKGTTKESRDMWSLGVILYTMLCGNTPFMPKNIDKQRDEKNYRAKLTENIKRGAFNTECPHWESLSKVAKDLIASLLRVNEEERLTLQQVLEHPWMTSLEEEKTDVKKAEDEAELINVDDDEETMQMPAAAENKSREENCSNDSSGIVLSERNDGSSLSSHEDVQKVSKSQDTPVKVQIDQVEKRPQNQVVTSRSFKSDLKDKETTETEVPEKPKAKTRGRKRKREVIKREKQQELSIVSVKASVDVTSIGPEIDEIFSGFHGFPPSNDILPSLDIWRNVLFETPNASIPKLLRRSQRSRKRNVVYNEEKLFKMSNGSPTSVTIDETVYTIIEFPEMPKPRRGRKPKQTKTKMEPSMVKVINMTYQDNNQEVVKPKPTRNRKRKFEETKPQAKEKKPPRKKIQIEVDAPIFDSSARYPKRNRGPPFTFKAEPIQKQITQPLKFASKLIKREKVDHLPNVCVTSLLSDSTPFAEKTYLGNNDRPSMIQERRCYLPNFV